MPSPDYLKQLGLDKPLPQPPAVRDMGELDPPVRDYGDLDPVRDAGEVGPPLFTGYDAPVEAPGTPAWDNEVVAAPHIQRTKPTQVFDPILAKQFASAGLKLPEGFTAPAANNHMPGNPKAAMFAEPGDPDYRAPAKATPVKGHFAGDDSGEAAPVKPATGGGSGVSRAQAEADLAARLQSDEDAAQPYITQQAGIAARASAEEDIASLRGDSAGAKGVVVANAEERVRQIAQDRDDAIAEHTRKLESFQREIAEGKIDTDRWWNSRDTGQKAAFFLSAALGGFLAGFKGGPNEALNMAQQSIDRDIDAQKANFEHKRAGANIEESLIGQLYKRFGSMEEAELTAKGLALDHLDAELNEKLASSNSTIATANGLVMQGEIAERRALNEEKKLEFQQKEAMQLALHRMRAGGGGGGKESELDKEIEKLVNKEAAAKIPQGEQALDDVAATQKADEQALIPSTSMPGKVLGALSHAPVVGGVANFVRGEAARQAEQARLNASQQLTAAGMRGTGGAMMVQKGLEGGNTAAGRHKGIQEARARLAAQQAQLEAGHRPEVAAELHRREGALRPPPGKPLNLKPMSEK